MTPEPRTGLRRSGRAGPREARPARRADWPLPNLHWWREVLIIVGFYAVYTVTRDLHATKGGFVQSLHNALKLVHIEQALGIFQERWLQHSVIHFRGFMEFWNSYYGTVHFIAVIFMLVVLFFRYPDRYGLWRNTLAFTTGLALIGFAFFPVLPPRLLPASYHFVDSLKTIGGVWNFSHGIVAKASNQYAAMPSLHTAWSTWCALAAMPLIRPRWGKWLVWLYPVATVFCIVVTGNHYFLDAIAGVVTVAIGYGLARLVTGLVAYRRFGRRVPLVAPPTDGDGLVTVTAAAAGPEAIPVPGDADRPTALGNPRRPPPEPTRAPPARWSPGNQDSTPH